MTGASMSAASATRASTRVSGGRSCRATATKKNVAPHRTERTMSKSQSVVRMAESLASDGAA